MRKLRRPIPLQPSQVDAIVDLYDRHFEQVARYLYRRLGGNEYEDAAADVFERAARAIGSLSPGSPALPWLYGISANVVIDRYRAERRRLAALRRLVDESPSPSPAATEHGLTGELVDGLADLSPADRETLLLVAWGELSYQETAEALGVPIGTVRSRISRARAHLAPRLRAAQGSSSSVTTPNHRHSHA